MLTVLDLFSGIGGMSLGLERAGGFQTAAFCEISPFCRNVLKGHWPEVPIYEDVTTADFTPGQADIVTGGFPCQDLSFAGEGAGITGERSGLYREVVRALRVVGPRHAIMENVAALLSNGMGVVLGDVAAHGYDAEWDCISASDIGAPHGRDRVWITVTDPDKQQQPGWVGAGLGWWEWGAEETGPPRDANGKWQLQPPRLLGDIRRRVDDAANSRIGWADHWQAKFEAFRRMDDGVPTRLDRSAMSAAVSALGNSLLPQIPEIIGRSILKAEGLTA